MQEWLSGINEHAALGRMCDSRRPELFVSVLFPQAECGKLVNVPMGEGEKGLTLPGTKK